MPRSTQLIIVTVAVLYGYSSQAAPPADLTADERRVVETIQQRDVQSTVAFLSSDEMAGRQTPSKELAIASRFVASRFQAAGLEPLGDDGSFFHVHQFDVSQPPANGFNLQIDDGAPLKALGILCGTAEPIDLSTEVFLETAALQADSPLCAVIEEVVFSPQARDKPQAVLLTLRRRLRGLTGRGVKLVLMKCGSDSPAVAVAQQLQQKPMSTRKGMQPECAVVLISENSDIAEKNIAATIEAQRHTTVPVRNVLGVLRGSDELLAEEAVMVTAHLDHIGVRSFGDDKIFNGADDNASGVTAVLALADALTSLQTPPQRSVIFGTFWGEEKGLLGSKAFAEQPLWPLGKIAANINLEMIGRPETDAREKIWMTGWKHSDLGSFMNAGAQRVGVEVFDRTDVGEMLYNRSDNYSLARNGVVAHSFSAGSLHADYHQPSDEWQKLDLPHMTKVIQGLFGGVLHVANSSDRPQ